MTKDAKAFYYKGDTAGYFDCSRLPALEGRYGYTPVRGLGHQALMKDLCDNNQEVKCYFDLDDSRFYFDVLDCPEQGVLEISKVLQIKKSLL
jgi:hypothetical protein